MAAICPSIAAAGPARLSESHRGAHNLRRSKAVVSVRAMPRRHAGRKASVRVSAMAAGELDRKKHFLHLDDFTKARAVQVDTSV